MGLKRETLTGAVDEVEKRMAVQAKVDFFVVAAVFLVCLIDCSSAGRHLTGVRRMEKREGEKSLSSLLVPIGVYNHYTDIQRSRREAPECKKCHWLLGCISSC